RCPAIGAELRQLVRRHDRRLVLPRQRYGIAQMVAMAVGEQNRVEVGELVGCDDGGGVTGKEWVDDDALSVSLQHETGVSVECGFHSPTCFAYASARSSPSNSLGSWSFTFTIQPLP